MDTFIKSRVIKVGNSQGIRIPKLLLEQSGIQENVKIEVRDRQIVITAAEHAREGWAEAFAMMAGDGDSRSDDWEWNPEAARARRVDGGREKRDKTNAPVRNHFPRWDEPVSSNSDRRADDNQRKALPQ